MTVIENNGIGRAKCAHGLAQASEWQRTIRKILGRDDDDVDVARERPVLKSVVQHVHRRAEVPLGKRAGQRALIADEHAGARNRAREHQRFITGFDRCPREGAPRR